MKRILRKIYWLMSSQFGIDPLRLFCSLRGLPHFIIDWWKFRKDYLGSIAWMPCLHDRYAESGITKSEYFWQDLLVARWIHAASPEKHVDVGSRVDGFIAHVASFREIEVLDIRPNTSSIPGVIFRQADLMNAASLPGGGYCDSLSCLHALEHFGLGRYGDAINTQGFLQGIENMTMLLRPGGTFYISTPIGKERVEFNAHRVFDPRTILEVAKTNKLKLKRLMVFNASMGASDSGFDELALSNLANQHYNLGIFTFIKSER